MIVIRCDAGRKTGYGHLRRCMALAACFKKIGLDTMFLMCSPEAVVQDILASQGMALTVKGSHLDCLAWLGAHKNDISLSVIDHYEIGIDMEKQFFGLFPVMVIDDLCRAHWCDVLVDQTFGRTSAEYLGKLPYSGTRVLAGSRYALIDPVYRGVRTCGSRRDVLLTFGATDHQKAVVKVLDMLENRPGMDRLTFHVPLSSLSPCLSLLENRKTRLDLRIYKDLKDLGFLYARCGVAVGAPGVSILERLYCGLLNIAVMVAQNQESVGRALGKKKAVIFLGDMDSLEGERIEAELNRLIRKTSCAEQLEQNAAGIIDGRGPQRVIAQAVPLFSRVSLRPARSEDKDLLYQWQQQPGARQYFNNPAVPGEKEHAAWFDRVMSGMGTHLYMIEWRGLAVGYLRLDDIGSDRQISILVASKYRGTGFARAALSELLTKFPGKYRAMIHPENTASLSLFKSLNFIPGEKGDSFLWQV